MPALKSQRQEMFCHLILQGIPPYRAYPMAGYKQDTGAPYRLSENIRTKRRLRELRKAMSEKTRVTVESITSELDAIRRDASASGQHAAAHAAVTSKAKLHGLMVERKEMGQPGDFASLQTAEQVLDAVRTELGDDVAALIGAALARRDEAQPGGSDVDTADVFPATEGNA